MLELEQLYEEWNLTNLKLLDANESRSVFRCDYSGSKACLKMYHKTPSFCEEKGTQALVLWDGVATVRVFESTQHAVLMQDAGSFSLKQHLLEYGEESSVLILCKVLRALHGHQHKHKLTVPFPTLGERLLRLSRPINIDETDAYRIKALVFVEELRGKSGEQVLLHGDMHHLNIWKDDAGEWRGIDPQPVIGDRPYDFANIFYNPDDQTEIVESSARLEKLANTIERETQFDAATLLKWAFVHGVLSIAWQADDEQDPSRRLRVLRLINSIV
jgi:streptomycin 6-kinase